MPTLRASDDLGSVVTARVCDFRGAALKDRHSAHFSHAVGLNTSGLGIRTNPRVRTVWFVGAMGLLDDAIREHLELKRLRGADPGDVAREEQAALGPVRRGDETVPDDRQGEEAAE